MSNNLPTMFRMIDEIRKEGENYHRKERKYGSFTKTMELSFKIDADKAEASFENGLLSLTLPQMESEKPKIVTVKTLS